MANNKHCNWKWMHFIACNPSNCVNHLFLNISTHEMAVNVQINQIQIKPIQSNPIELNRMNINELNRYKTKQRQYKNENCVRLSSHRPNSRLMWMNARDEKAEEHRVSFILDIMSNSGLPYDFVLPKTRFFFTADTCSFGFVSSRVDSLCVFFFFLFFIQLYFFPFILFSLLTELIRN